MDAPSGPQLVTQRVALDSLQLDPSNARAHGDRNLEAIAASLRRFGQAEPLVVQAGTRRVIAGNGRLVAMRQLGWRECDVVFVAVDDVQATALGIALNRTAELAEWDEAVLARLLSELRAEDALEAVGFDEREIDALIAELGDADSGLSVEDPGPEELPEKPVTVPGDLWLLGEHRLVCGDSRDPATLERLLGDERADPARREVDHRHDQSPEQVVLAVERGQLRARSLQTKLAEVDRQLVGRFARLREVVDGDDPADAHVHPGEVVVVDLPRGCHGRGTY